MEGSRGLFLLVPHVSCFVTALVFRVALGHRRGQFLETGLDQFVAGEAEEEAEGAADGGDDGVEVVEEVLLVDGHDDVGVEEVDVAQAVADER